MNAHQIDIERLQFHHYIVSSDKPYFFAHAKVDSHFENFIIYLDHNIVKRQIDRHFEALPPGLASVVRLKAMLNYKNTPIYKVSRYYFV